mmetsp:Transcript_40617/g.114985  ORF Transcript_40617/g.114985 Transcript_40617/m.114985 type:complete len:270 (-) Transcript_40617:495-1304(-)
MLPTIPAALSQSQPTKAPPSKSGPLGTLSQPMTMAKTMVAALLKFPAKLVWVAESDCTSQNCMMLYRKVRGPNQKSEPSTWGPLSRTTLSSSMSVYASVSGCPSVVCHWLMGCCIKRNGRMQKRAAGTDMQPAESMPFMPWWPSTPARTKFSEPETRERMQKKTPKKKLGSNSSPMELEASTTTHAQTTPRVMVDSSQGSMLTAPRCQNLTYISCVVKTNRGMQLRTTRFTEIGRRERPRLLKLIFMPKEAPKTQIPRTSRLDAGTFGM